MIFSNMDRIIFAGDSVTDMESACPVGEGLFDNLGKSYVRIIDNMLSAYYMEPISSDLMRARMDVYGNIAKKLADEFHCEFIDLQKMFDEYFKFRHSSFIAWDRVHPNQVGATLIAREFLSHCGFDPLHIPKTSD